MPSNGEIVRDTLSASGIFLSSDSKAVFCFSMALCHSAAAFSVFHTGQRICRKLAAKDNLAEPADVRVEKTASGRDADGCAKQQPWAVRCPFWYSMLWTFQ